MQTVPSTSPCIHVHSMSVIEMTESSSEIAAQAVSFTLTPQTLEHCWFPHNWGRGAELTCNVNLNSVHFKQAWLFIKQMKAMSCREAAPEAALGGVWWWAWRHCRSQPAGSTLAHRPQAAVLPTAAFGCFPFILLILYVCLAGLW